MSYTIYEVARAVSNLLKMCVLHNRMDAARMERMSRGPDVVASLLPKLEHDLKNREEVVP